MVGALTHRRCGMKTMWRDLSARARLGEIFGFIDAIALLYKAGTISREQVKQYLSERVSKADLAEYRRVRSNETLVAAGTIHR
jgi:divalent metal cation (Fe/Co/Zn/Cd) transporter